MLAWSISEIFQEVFKKEKKGKLSGCMWENQVLSSSKPTTAYKACCAQTLQPTGGTDGQMDTVPAWRVWLCSQRILLGALWNTASYFHGTSKPWPHSIFQTSPINHRGTSGAREVGVTPAIQQDASGTQSQDGTRPPPRLGTDTKANTHRAFYK